MPQLVKRPSHGAMKTAIGPWTEILGAQTRPTWRRISRPSPATTSSAERTTAELPDDAGTPSTTVVARGCVAARTWAVSRDMRAWT